SASDLSNVVNWAEISASCGDRPFNSAVIASISFWFSAAFCSVAAINDGPATGDFLGVTCAAAVSHRHRIKLQNTLDFICYSAFHPSGFYKAKSVSNPPKREGYSRNAWRRGGPRAQI